MKKLLFVLVLILVGILFVACNDNKQTSPVDITNVPSVETEIPKTDEERIIEENANEKVEEPDFTKKAGFKVVKSDSLSGVVYDNIFSIGSDGGQIDFVYSSTKKASLMILKTNEFTQDPDVEYNVFPAGDVEVTSFRADDGLYHYFYEKDNLNYSLTTKDIFEKEEIIEIVNGFTTEK